MNQILKEWILDCPSLTREEVISTLGEPDDKAIGTRKYKSSPIFLYEDVELFFEPWKTGNLYLVKKRAPESLYDNPDDKIYKVCDHCKSIGCDICKGIGYLEILTN